MNDSTISWCISLKENLSFVNIWCERCCCTSLPQLGYLLHVPHLTGPWLAVVVNKSKNWRWWCSLPHPSNLLSGDRWCDTLFQSWLRFSVMGESKELFADDVQSSPGFEWSIVYIYIGGSNTITNLRGTQTLSSSLSELQRTIDQGTLRLDAPSLLCLVLQLAPGQSRPCYGMKPKRTEILRFWTWL